MKNVLIIYTGGTIGMTRTENGYAPQSGQFRRAMEAIPDLYAEQMPRWDMLEMDPLLDSSNMTVHEWNKIAQLVADHYDAYGRLCGAPRHGHDGLYRLRAFLYA